MQQVTRDVLGVQEQTGEFSEVGESLTDNNQHHDLKLLIREAFATVKHPGDWCLRGSNEGDEPFLTEEEFTGKTDWRGLDAAFLDQSPAGLGTALCYLSDEAFRFYLPAYLIADIDGLLLSVNPAFHLYHGLLDESQSKRVNRLRYGERTWFEAQRHKFSIFDYQQVSAIIAYLQFKRNRHPLNQDFIDQALRNYWLPRVEAARQAIRAKPGKHRRNK